jgi:hypothetical protein
MIEKEITTAEYDLERSKESMKDEDYKWASVPGILFDVSCSKGTCS